MKVIEGRFQSTQIQYGKSGNIISLIEKKTERRKLYFTYSILTSVKI